MNTLQKTTEGVELVHYQSAAIDLATPLSAIDVQLAETVHATDASSKRLRDIAERIFKSMTKSSACITSVKDQHISTHDGSLALYMTHIESNTALRILLSSPSSSRASMIKGWLEEQPLACPLHLVLKTMLDVRGLSDSSTGGLDSYTLLSMLVVFLRLFSKGQSHSIGAALQEFLDFVAQFNTRDHYLNVEPPSILSKHIRGRTTLPIKHDDEQLHWQRQMANVHPNRPWLLCVQDPSDISEDIGKSCYRIMDIRMTFRVLSQRLHSWLTAPCGKQIEDPLTPFFGKMLGSVRDRRGHLLRWAKTFSRKIESTRR